MKNTIGKTTINDELNENACVAHNAAHGGDLTLWTEAEIVAENARRCAALVQDYDPMMAVGAVATGWHARWAAWTICCRALWLTVCQNPFTGAS